MLLWLLEGDLKHISPKALQEIDGADLLVSPIVLLEAEYLYEIERTYLSSKDVQFRMESDLNIRVCDLSFSRVVEAALNEKWTRDPFDRMIVSQARARNSAPLITADGRMRKHYPEALW